MALRFERLHKHFVAEVSPVDLRQVHDPATLAEIRAGMDEYAVLIFHDQALTDQDHLGRLQKAADVQVFQQGRDRLVQVGQSPAQAKRALAEDASQAGPFAVHEFTLYSSHPGKGHSVYQEEATYPLEAA